MTCQNSKHEQARLRDIILVARESLESESRNNVVCYFLVLTPLNLFYRFYYIFLGRTMTWISEEKFIRYLHLCGPVISGLVITMHCVENLLFYCDHPTMFYYREGATSGLGPEMIVL